MYIDTGSILLLAAGWACWQTWAMNKVLRAVEGKTDARSAPKRTFADIVEYERQMASTPETPPAQTPTDNASPAWSLMRAAHEKILRDRGMESAEFPWNKEQCDAYWRSQELSVARRFPDLPKDTYFDSLVDKQVVANMWAMVPREEEAPTGFPPCAICGEPGVMMTGEAAYCGEHSHLWRHGASVPPPAPEVPADVMPVVTPASAPDGECGISDGASLCDLPVGHGGAHSWAAPPSGGSNHRDAFTDMITGRFER